MRKFLKPKYFHTHGVHVLNRLLSVIGRIEPSLFVGLFVRNGIVGRMTNSRWSRFFGMVVVVAVLTVVPVVHLRVVAALLKVPFASTLSADMMTSSAALETVTVVPPVSMTSAPTAVVTAAVLLTTAAVEDGTSMLISVVRDGPVLGVDRDS